MSKVMLLTSYGMDRDWPKLAEITTATHRKYADIHGYDYFADMSNVQTPLRSPWVDDRKSGYAPMRTMIKFPLLEHYLTDANCQKHYDAVVWIDADCVITNFDFSISDALQLDAKADKGDEACAGDLIVAEDVNGLHPTIIACRNSLRMRGLIWACGNAGKTMFLQHDWSDILALRFYLATPPFEDLVSYWSAKILCAMPPGVYDIPPDIRSQYEWTPESWSLHLSALSVEDRIRLAKQWVEQYNLL